MNVIKIKAVFDYLLASIFVGVILGVCGAFAAQGFRTGIVFISNHLGSFFSNDPNFFFYFATLTLALVFVHYARVIINGRPFESVADSIIWPIKPIMKQMLKLGLSVQLLHFFLQVGAQALANMVHWCILEQPLAHG